MSEQLPHAKRIKSVLHVTVPALLGCRAALASTPMGPVLRTKSIQPKRAVVSLASANKQH